MKIRTVQPQEVAFSFEAILKFCSLCQGIAKKGVVSSPVKQDDEEGFVGVCATCLDGMRKALVRGERARADRGRS